MIIILGDDLRRETSVPNPYDSIGSWQIIMKQWIINLEKRKSEGYSNYQTCRKANAWEGIKK